MKLSWQSESESEDGSNAAVKDQHDYIETLAQKHGFSRDAVEIVMRAMLTTNGRSAQFNHPELGGFGQWMPGMIQIGDMFNTALQGRVNALCSDLSVLLARMPTEVRMPAYVQWWPAELGIPNTSGGQNELHYAYFATQHVLLVRRGQHLTRYDTSGYTIQGVMQQQTTGSATFVCTTDRGIVTLDQFKIVS